MQQEQLTPQEARRRELQSNLDFAKERRKAATEHYRRTLRKIELEEREWQQELTLLTQTKLF